MAQAEAATVRKQVVVEAPIERAFSVFTDRFGDFKPPEHTGPASDVEHNRPHEPTIVVDAPDRG